MTYTSIYLPNINSVYTDYGVEMYETDFNVERIVILNNWLLPSYLQNIKYTQ